MAKEFKLPDPGEGIHEAEIVAVKVSSDERVEESQVLLEVETDKAVVEVPASFTGTVTEVLVEVGDRVEVGEAVLRYESEDDDADADSDAEGGEGEQDGAEARVADTDDREEAGERSTSKSPDEGKEQDDDDEEEDEEEGEAEGRAPQSGDRPVPAAPATRRLARELDVDLRAVEPSGPEGRVLPEDVRSAAGGGEEERDAAAAQEQEEARTEAAEAAGGEEATETAEAPETADAGEAPEDEEAPEAEEQEDEEAPEGEEREAGKKAQDRWGPVRREPLRSVRRTTAERLSRSWSRAPHVTHFDRADITELERFRDEQAAAMEDGGDDLTLTVFVLKAAVAALKEHPRFNAHFDDDTQELVIFERHNLGLAVDTDRGLLVPVVHDVESKSLAELARETARLQERTRAGKLERDEMRGGSFTLTNPGPIGGTAFTPIINPPQVAILGTARASWEPTVVEDDEGRTIVPRKLLPLCLAFDHRVNDGADAARFVSRLVAILEDPDTLVRHL